MCVVETTLACLKVFQTHLAGKVAWAAAAAAPAGCRGVAFAVISLSLSWHYNKMPFQSLLTKCNGSGCWELPLAPSNPASQLPFASACRASASFGNFSTGISKNNNGRDWVPQLRRAAAQKKRTKKMKQTAK